MTNSITSSDSQEPLPETGVIHGRFQVLHNDHMKYLIAGKRRCRHLVVGITNPDPILTKTENTDPGRSDIAENPLTYYERYQLVHHSLKDNGIKNEDFSIVPFPINLPELYRYYVPLDATFFLTIYDEWGRQKLQYFKSMGLKTCVLWEASIEKKGISGSDVRKRIQNGKPWDHLVPPAVSGFIMKWNIKSRLSNIA